MGIDFKNIDSEKLSILFTNSKIIGILGNFSHQKKEFMDLLQNSLNLENNDSKKLKKVNKEKKIYYLNFEQNNILFNINIREDIKYYLGNYSEEKLQDFFKDFDLDSKILDKNYLELCSGETQKILLIIGLMSTSNIIVLEHPTLKLDFKSIQVLVKKLRKLRRESKTIIIVSYNTNFLLETVDNIILVENGKITNFENKFDILCDEKIMNKLNLKIPDVLNFINKVKRIKNIKLNYRENINDLIKDIYRHAK